MTPTAQGAVFKAATDVATDLGRVRDLDELTRVLGRAAEVMDASGLMVWIGSATGADLRPVLAHGYSAEMIARMPPVPRSADNAAAAAYRSGHAADRALAPRRLERRRRRADPVGRRLHRRPVRGDPQRRRNVGKRPGARRHLRRQLAGVAVAVRNQPRGASESQRPRAAAPRSGSL